MYSFSTELKQAHTDFDDALNIIRAAFVAEKMGIVSEINVKGIFKKKLDIDYDDYTILGACMAPLAKRVLDVDINAGVLLPCNVAVRQQNNKIIITFMHPQAISDMVDDPEIAKVANEALQKLEAVKARLGD